MVPYTHPVFDHGTPVSAISERIGMPLYTYQYPKDKRFNDSGDVDNQPVIFMHTSIDPKKSGFGWAPAKWQNNVGNVLLACRDRKALEPDVAEAFGNYCQLHLEAYEQWQMEKEGEHANGPNDTRFKDFVLAEVTPEKWETYLKQWRYVREHNDYVIGGLIDGIARMGVTEGDAERVSHRLFANSNPFWATFGATGGQN